MNSKSNASRRHFLVGAGGATLALPLLGSLLAPRDAHAAALNQKCFVQFQSPHGGIWQSEMFPAASTLTETRTYAGHTIRRGNLQLSTANGEGRLSTVLRGPSTKLTPALAAKMNVVNGLDLPFYIGHNRAFTLGNFSDSDQARSEVLTNCRRATIDNLLAWSPSFYRDTSTVKERVIVVGNLSWANASPQTRTGPLQRVGGTAESNIALFDKLFGTVTATGRPLIVDQVAENYRRLRDSNRRLSAEDRRRLTEHMERIFELQRKLQLATGAPPTRPATNNLYDMRRTQGYDITPNSQVRNQELWNDVVTAAFSTGLSCIYVASPFDTFSDYAGDWHQDIVHRDVHATVAAANQRFFQSTVLDLASKLDAVSMGGGRTLLDNALVVWGQESGNHTHEAVSVPAITFGSALGAMRTGQYCDFRNLNRTFNTPDGDPLTYGLLWHQWLGTVLQVMGLAKSEYENTAQNGGYPDFRYADDFGTGPQHPASVWNATGEMLPWLSV